MQFPFVKGERQFPALSAYFYYKQGAQSIFLVGPSGQASGDFYELEPINLWLAKAYGVSFGICHLAEWHARELLRKHQINFAQTKVHLELNYNPQQPVLLNKL